MDYRILVVDDEETLRLTFKKFLLGQGYNVVTAKDYDEALDCISKAEIDLIFADIILGDKTGIDLLKEAKTRKISSPFVMITGYPNIETASEAVRLGAFDYIPKPVRQDTLLQAARKALRYKAVIDEKEKYRLNLEAIFRSVEDAIITVDKEMVVVEINGAVNKICGVSPDHAIGKRFDVFPNGCNKKCLKALTETLTKKKPVKVFRLECPNHNRQGQIVSLSSTPLLDTHGSATGAVMVIRDETQLASLERDLKERKQFHNIIGKSEEMQRIYSLLEELADVQTTVLITGESGTGKELVAEALHYNGERSGKPLVKVNCASLSEGLLESELFGHVKGAFTGAVKDKVGRFQKADGGTILLDEIGDISPRVQLRLLRVLQEREFDRVGDSNPIRVDVRIIAATNQDLQEKVRLGEFREDLYYRLKVVEVTMPALRERRKDIPHLVSHFIEKFNSKLQKNIETISDDVLELFMDYPWPGNVRELENILEHACILCRHNIIAIECLPLEFQEYHETQGASHKVSENLELQTILQALEKTAGNKARAARLLGISRQTMYRKINQYNIKNI